MWPQPLRQMDRRALHECQSSGILWFQQCGWEEFKLLSHLLHKRYFSFSPPHELFADSPSLCPTPQLVTPRRSALPVGQRVGQAVFMSCWRIKHPWAFTLAGNNLTGSTSPETTLDTSKFGTCSPSQAPQPITTHHCSVITLVCYTLCNESNKKSQ